MKSESQDRTKKVAKGSNSRGALLGSLRRTLSEYRARPELLFDVAMDLYESLNTPVSLSLAILLRYKDYEQLVRKSVSPFDYNEPSKFRDDYQAVSFLKKAPLKIEGVDPEAAARVKFLEAERACADTNARIRAFVSDPVKAASEPVRHAISAAMGKIANVLGSAVNAREWLYACRFGPGTFNHPVSKGLTSLYDKLQVRPSVSPDMVEVAAGLIMSQPHWARSVTDCEVEGFWPLIKREDLTVTPGNKVAFVPKTAVTHRAIAIEPLMNVYAQLGLGTVMRRKLARVGIDLDDQAPNQRAALKGSLDGSLATIDLSSASDTVAKELVRLLLPEGWFSVLDMTRSKVGYYEGNWLKYEKFSSMGNGYTFELETLIFWALVSSCVESLAIETDEVLVYGDDIVVPVAAYGLVEEVLTWCGFTLNKGKSFASGPFRESCGKDYYAGVDVRPFFVKELPYEIQTLFRLANGLRQTAFRRASSLGCCIRLFQSWRRVVRAIPRPVATHCRVPAHAGADSGIICNWDEAQTSNFVVSNKDGWEGSHGLRYQPTPIEGSKPSNWLGVIATQLYRLSDGGKFEAQLIGAPREGWAEWLAGLEDSVSASPRQERGCTYRLQRSAFYGPWTNLGEWVNPTN
jgi:hypothetical protein